MTPTHSNQQKGNPYIMTPVQKRNSLRDTYQMPHRNHGNTSFFSDSPHSDVELKLMTQFSDFICKTENSEFLYNCNIFLLVQVVITCFMGVCGCFSEIVGERRS